MSEEEKVLTLVVSDVLSDEDEKSSAQVVAEPEDEAYDTPKNHVTRFGTTMKKDGWKEQLKMAGAVTTATSAGASRPVFGKKPKEEEDEDE
tara:strand:+ start:154 stop:426 length:273 start_codon:yes stop_codon:yes gene_type:complete